MTIRTLPEAAGRWRSWAIGQRVGSLHVVDAAVTADEDVNGATAIFLDLTLSAVSDGHSWPVDDLLALHDLFDNRARELELSAPWHVRLFPADADLSADAEDE
ncbi:MAG: hypothetical protein ABJC62_12895 [Frankiaceae bacterium]